MFLITINQYVAPRSQRPGVAYSRRDERLRRAGYADGERLPRKQHHWANR